MIGEQHLAFEGQIAIYEAQKSSYSFWRKKYQ